MSAITVNENDSYDLQDYDKYLIEENVGKYIEVDTNAQPEEGSKVVYEIVKDDDNKYSFVYNSSYDDKEVNPLMKKAPTSNKRRRTSSSHSPSSKSRSASSRSRSSPSSKSPRSMSSNKRHRTSKSRGGSKRNSKKHHKK